MSAAKGQQRRSSGMMGGPPGSMPTEKAKNFKVSFRRLLGYLKPHKNKLIIVFILAIASTTFSIFFPEVLGKAMNKLQDGYTSGEVLKKFGDGQESGIKNLDKDMLSNVQKSIKNGFVDQMISVQKGLTKNQIENSKQEQEKVDPSKQQEMMLTMKEIMSIPSIESTENSDQKLEYSLKLLTLIEKLPKNNSKNNMSKDFVDFVKLPDLATINNDEYKNEVRHKIINQVKLMKEQTKNSTEKSSENMLSKIDEKTILNLDKFIDLKQINKTKDSNVKADTVSTLISFAKESPYVLYFMFKDSIEMKDGKPVQSTNKNFEMTDEQIEGVIKAIRETDGKIDFDYIKMIAIQLIIMYLISSLLSVFMGLVMSGVAQKTVSDLRTEVNDKLDRLPLKYYDSHPHGDILSRVTNDIDTIATTLQQSVTQIITSVITILGYIIMMLKISPILTILVIATLPVYVMVTIFVTKKSQKYFASQQKSIGELSGHVEEMYTGHKIVKAFGKEKESIEKFEKINQELYKSGWKAQFVSGVMFPMMNFISNIGYVAICVVGGFWITKNRLKFGDLTAFIQYSRSFTMPIIQTANIANIIQSTIACSERVFEVLDEAEEVDESANPIKINEVKGTVEIKNVDFRYVEDVPLIEKLNLKVNAGDTIAIVGPTGAGKTTLVNLLMRFYEINNGEILIDNVKSTEMRRADLRKIFGMVLQDTWLFNGSIKDNISYSKKDATMEEIISASKAAHADHFIRTLPEGYNTILNEEATNISQGQKQLLTIARAILSNPSILILDEATSSVDTRTEVMIQKAMSNLMKNRTSFVIAHRLSTIRDAESIIVMDKGNIIEMGNHKKLLSQKGFYYDLYNSQFA